MAVYSQNVVVIGAWVNFLQECKRLCSLVDINDVAVSDFIGAFRYTACEHFVI